MISSRIISQSVQNILTWRVTEKNETSLASISFEVLQFVSLVQQHWELELVNESQLGEVQMNRAPLNLA